MEFISIEVLEKFLNPKDLMTFGVIWFFVRKRVANHFVMIEKNLERIGDRLKSLNDNIVHLESSHLEKINELSGRVTALEVRDVN